MKAPGLPDITPIPEANPALVRGVQLSKFFSLQQGALGRATLIRAVEDASLSVHAGQTLGLVGESGSGKTTLGRMLLRLVEPTYGRIFFRGRDITHHNERDLRSLRKQMQIVFQDASSSLNVKLSVADIVAEPLRIHNVHRGRNKERAQVADLLSKVFVPTTLLDRTPAELSSGQRQRVSIARALALDPDFVVCDEPLGALDPAEQAQIADLLVSLQRTRRLSYLFISHDLRMVLHMSHQVAVMYAGRIVETGPAEALMAQSLHPYTRALISSVPDLDPGRRRLRLMLNDVEPGPDDALEGCAFRRRCPRAEPGLCEREVPSLMPLEPGSPQEVACWHPHQ